MPYKELMNWDEGKKRWHRKYKGTMYRVVPSALDADKTLPRVMVYSRDGTRNAANVWWERRQSEIDGVPSRDHVAEAVAAHKELVRKIEVERVSDLVDDALHRGERQEDMTAHKLIAAIREAVSGPVPSSRTLKALVERFLTAKMTDAKPLTFREVRDYLRSLIAAKGEGDDVGAWGEDVVEKEFVNLKRLDLTSGTKKKRWGFYCRFVRYCASLRILPLPANLDEYGFTVEAKAVKTYKTSEVRSLLSSLPSRFKLYAMLGLNCGMTSADMGCLRKDNVNLMNGTLTRRRVKTGDNGNVPTVTYTLWPETVSLLAEHWSDDAELALTSEDGTVMWSASQDGDKTPAKDLIGQQWRRRGIDIPLKAMRSIGASLLEGHKDYGRCSILYLAHSPKSVKDRHYVVPPMELFAEACVWLGDQFRQEGR